jgi:hypothetical protein
MYVLVSLTSNGPKGEKIVEVKALIDCGAGDTFIDKNFVWEQRLPTLPLGKPLKVFNVDGTPNKEGTITHFTRLKTRINGSIKRTAFLVAGLGKEKVILGFRWLQTESPIIDWEQGTLQWKDNTPPKDKEEGDEEEEKKRIAEEMKDASKPVWIRAKTTASQQIAQKKEEKKKTIPLRQQIPKDYHDYLDRFDEKTASRFPGLRPWDHRTDLKPDFTPKRGKIYSLSPKEDKELDVFIKENLEKGYIRESQSPQASQFFFVAKKDGRLRPCQDYRKLNESTIRNAYPLPRIPDLLDKLKKARYFTKMDIWWGYNNIRIKDGDQ